VSPLGSDIPRISVLRRRGIDRLRFRRAPLVEEGSQDDVHAHLQKLRLPVLEGGLDEVSGCKVPEHRKLFVGTVFELFLVVCCSTGDNHADEEHAEQPQTGQN